MESKAGARHSGSWGQRLVFVTAAVESKAGARHIRSWSQRLLFLSQESRGWCLSQELELRLVPDTVAEVEAGVLVTAVVGVKGWCSS